MGLTKLQDKTKNYDTDELIDIVNSSDEVVDYDREPNDVEKFIADVGIKSGETRVRAMKVYERYKEWKGKHSKTLLTVKKFFTIFQQIFPKNRDQYSIYYCLDPSPFTFRDYQPLIRRRKKKPSNGEEKEENQKKS